MESKLSQALIQLGCNDKERRFFLACFKLGPSSIADIASKAKLQRSTAYLLADQLISKGLLVQDYRTYNKLYSAASPQTIIRLLETSKRKLGKISMDMQNNITALEELHSASEQLPVVTTHQGTSGLISIWRDILSSPGEILLWTNQATEPRIFESSQHQQFINERIKKSLSIRVLAVNNREGNTLLLHDTEQLRKTRLLPPETVFSAETYLYSNKMAIVDYRSGLFGLVVASQFIYEAQQSIFEMTWEALGDEAGNIDTWHVTE